MVRCARSESFQNSGFELSSSSSWISCSLAGTSKTHPDPVEAIHTRDDGLFNVIDHDLSLTVPGTGDEKTG